MPGDVLKRALIAYYRALVKHGDRLPPQPPVPMLVTHADTTYILLRTPDTLLAVYKVTSTGALQRLSRWPQALEECVEHSCSR